MRSETVPALVATAPGQMQMRQIAEPADLGGGALGKVLAAGLCGSDPPLLAGAHGSHLFPFLLGHENVVRIERADETYLERHGVNVGDRVLVEEFVPCGLCASCRSGHANMCPRTDFRSPSFLRYGRTPLAVTPGLWGGLAERLYMHPDAALHPIPPSLTPTAALLAVPIANGLRWVVDVGGARPGDSVVVMGPGGHGLGCVIAAKDVGAAPVILVGTDSDGERLALGRDLGADITVTNSEDVAGVVGEATAGELARVVVDVTGSPAGAALAPKLAGRHGRVVLAGGAVGAGFPSDLVTVRELAVYGVRGHLSDGLERALALLDRTGLANTTEISAPVELTGVADALRLLADGHARRPAHFAISYPNP